MTELSKAQQKKILLDPVAHYKEQNQADSDENLTELIQFNQQHKDRNLQLKEIQDKSKKISRQIGEAKREKHSCEELLQTMRQYSAESKDLKSQLDVIAEKILIFFNTNVESDTKMNSRPDMATHPRTESDNKLPPTRVHSTAEVDTKQLSIRLLDTKNNTDDHEHWSHYVESNPASSLYHRIQWVQLIQDVFGHECYYFYATVDKKVVGILPLVRLNSRLFGDFMVSMPYFNSGGALGDSLQIEQQLMQSASEHADKVGSQHIEYRDDISREKMPVRDEKVNMILALADSTDGLWQNFSSKLRAQIKRPQRENTAVTVGGLDCLNDFYTVFAQNMRDLGTPVYSKSFFSEILSTFPKSSKIVIVHLANKPVAAAFLLGHNETLEIPWASTIKSVNHLSMNMLLYWEVLKFAVDSRYSYFDFGRSSKGSGTFRFKQQWGAKPKQCYWHYWLKGGAELPSLNPNNPKFKLVIAVWKRIPVWLTKIIGPGIVKNLP